MNSLDDKTLPLVSIIIGTYNESVTIGDTVKTILQEVRAPVEVVVVDDDSPDGTAAVVTAMEEPCVRVIQRKRGKGLASAISRGIVASRGEFVGWFDADMAREAVYIHNMVELISEGNYDIVIASRYVEGGGDSRASMRVNASILVNSFARLILGPKIHDYSSCIAIVRREVFNDVLPIPYGFGDFFIEFVYQCVKKGFRVHEMPFNLGTREAGTSKSYPSFGGFIWMGLKYVIRILAARFRPD